ncbi:hypothetical protein [Amycolatopsis albispora]|uniref:Uncharacterized protein n=1 Tax=Amycolatopsis albispora TaxID=1804986 RepID=A0A344L8I9_9PSEU|nr:hypothetical protein [Amycolatopsis albispora]AXB44363.1 hypothetical protein A4R43_19080 [Amycolatopsis albispora]
MGRSDAFRTRHRSILITFLLVLQLWIAAAPTGTPVRHEPHHVGSLAAEPQPEPVTTRHAPAPVITQIAVLPPGSAAPPAPVEHRTAYAAAPHADPGHPGDPAEARAPPARRLEFDQPAAAGLPR